jgi:hypothetical protein
MSIRKWRKRAEGRRKVGEGEERPVLITKHDVTLVGIVCYEFVHGLGRVGVFEKFNKRGPEERALRKRRRRPYAI